MVDLLLTTANNPLVAGTAADALAEKVTGWEEASRLKSSDPAVSLRVADPIRWRWRDKRLSSQVSLGLKISLQMPETQEEAFKDEYIGICLQSFVSMRKKLLTMMTTICQKWKPSPLPTLSRSYLAMRKLQVHAEEWPPDVLTLTLRKAQCQPS